MVYSTPDRLSLIRKKRLTAETLPPRCIAELSSRAIQSNYSVLRELAGAQEILPMVKADAYGHGAEWVAGLLAELPQLYGLGVATFEEGMALRENLGPRRRRISILVFSGAAPWSDLKGEICERYGLVPVLYRIEDWDIFFKTGWNKRIRYELKFNTGMNRLGIPYEYAQRVLKDLKQVRTNEAPQGILSHLALGEDADHKLSMKQRERFKQIRSLFEPHFPAIRFHLGNSAALWSKKKWRLDDLTDVVRPGISLYGVPPWAGAPARGISPVMKVRSQVLCIHELKKGETVGYGAKYTVEAGAPNRIAIVSAGYADGIHRALSEKGFALLGQKKERILGVISMDLTALSASTRVRVGDYAIWLGPGFDIWEQAQLAGTIPYELLTSISGRVKRISVPEHR